MFSPNGMQMVYTEHRPNYCTWLVDYEAKIISSLICKDILENGGSEKIHRPLGWLPGQPDKLLSLSILESSDDKYTGGLEILSLVDGSAQNLDSVRTTNGVLSPDRQTIAYDHIDFQPSGWLYSWDSGNQPFSPQDYGVNYPYLANPTWSPDGKKIAWGIINDVHSAIGVFDLENKTGRVLHPFVDGAYDMTITDLPHVPIAFWSPDGKWLALDTCVHDADQLVPCDPAVSGLWVMSEDGQMEYRIEGTFAGWSPDSQWVLSMDANYDANESELWISRLDGSETVSLEKTADAYHQFEESWSPDGKYLLFKGEDHVMIAEAGTWQLQQVGEAGKYMNLIWSPDGRHVGFMDENYAVWVAETGIWQFQQIAEIQVTTNTDGTNPWISFSRWQTTLLPSFAELTLIPSSVPTP
jgi:dipeptidyl aminopeptidase/acylaminoacyl peptidase